MPSSTAPISCSRETCFSALSWRRAPTKSRLIDRLLSQMPSNGRSVKKRGGHPRHGAAVQLERSIHPAAWTLNAAHRASDPGEELQDALQEEFRRLGAVRREARIGEQVLITRIDEQLAVGCGLYELLRRIEISAV